jgi:hypothetical protein
MRKPEQELADIKSMMEQSTRFLSLSGLSGILTGIYALIASALAYYWIYYPQIPVENQFHEVYHNGKITHLMLMGLALLTLTIATSWAFSRQKSKRNAHPLWTPASKRFVQALAIPVLSGGMFCIALIHEGQLILAFPAMLLFYGTGLLNASSFTLNNLKYLGYGQLILGVIAGFVPEWGFALWTLGFGVFHIIYGSMIYTRYER